MAKTILIVDDAPSVRQIVGRALKGAGYEVVEAVDGKDGLAKLDGTRYHLIISDLRMPVLDGVGFLEAKNKMAAYRFTPVIMLTTEASADVKMQARAAGARAWLTKPFEPATMLEAVAKICPP
jgi:two-component system chemotaxis response regulator CheY